MSAADSRARVRLGRSAGRCRSGASAGTAGTASAAGTASTAHRHLHHEDRLPRERLRQQSARHRSGGRADHAGRDPGRDAATLAVLRDQELEAADQGQRASERLQAAGREQHLDRRRRRAPRRGARRTPRSRGQQKIRGCARVNSRAIGTATSPSTRLNAISTQATCATEVCRFRRMSGRASVTTAESASTSATVTASRGATARRTRPSSHCSISSRRTAGCRV